MYLVNSLEGKAQQFRVDWVWRIILHSCICAVETARWDAKRAEARSIVPTRFSAFPHIRHRIHSVAVVGAQNFMPHPSRFTCLTSASVAIMIGNRVMVWGYPS